MRYNFILMINNADYLGIYFAGGGSGVVTFLIDEWQTRSSLNLLFSSSIVSLSKLTFQMRNEMKNFSRHHSQQAKLKSL